MIYLVVSFSTTIFDISKTKNMTTLERLAMHASEIMEKQRRGEALTKDDISVLKMHNSIYAKPAFNSGKRNGSSNTQKVK